jgi:poly(A) polymerase
VLEETFKILRCGGSARAFELLRACGALPVVLPSLGAALDSWDDAHRRGFFAHLSALDRLVRSGADVSDAAMLGALLIHLPSRGRGEGAPPAGGVIDAEGLLASLVETSRLPRKIAERARLALHAQRALHEPHRRRRRRGAHAQHEDALQLLRITVEATGEGREVLERWTARAERGHDERSHDERSPDERSPDERGLHARGSDARGSAEPGADIEQASPPPEPAPTPHAAPDAAAVAVAGPDGQPGGRRRRRRRGGRRRRRRGAGAAVPAES